MSESITKIIPKVSSTSDEKLCRKHGIPLTQIGDVYKLSYCQKCSEEAKAKDEERQRKKGLLEKQEAFEKAMSLSCLPKRHLNKGLDAFIVQTEKQKKVLNEALWLLENPNFTGAIFIGNTGTGKTQLATSLGIEFIKKGINCVYTTVLDIMLKIKRSWKDKSDLYEDEVINHYSSKNILIIDEVGVQFESETERLYITKIIDNRYNNLFSTILIGNVTIEELNNIVGDRAIRRIREEGRILIFDWEGNGIRNKN